MTAFLLRALLLGAALLGLTAPVSARQAPPPVEAFARLPATQGISLSPDGTRVAYITHSEGERLIMIEDLGGETKAVNLGDLRAFDTFWIDTETLGARVGELASVAGLRGRLDYTTILTINPETLEAEQLVRPRRGFGLNQTTARIAGYERDAQRLLMPLVDDDDTLNLYAVDPDNGHSRTLRARGRQATRYWVADPARNRYVRVSYSNRRDRFTVDIEDQNDWRPLINEEQDLIEIGVQGFLPNGQTLAVSHTPFQAPYTRRLQALSITDGAMGEILFQDPAYDFDEVIRDPYSGYVIGISIEREQRETIWFDEELSQLQRSLETSFGEQVVTLVSWSEDRTRFIVQAENGAQPIVYYLLDMNTRSADPLRLTYPELYRATLAERRQITYPARDGAPIPAYIASPGEETQTPRPYVVLVHGGPAARDTGGYDDFAHFLASRGYGVLQPQFRGSSGFGKAWETSGWGEWGRGRMQQDVTDAATYLRESGLASSICVMGASYGGYAALAAATFTPDVFDCAVSINGVSDPEDLLSYVQRRYGALSQSASYWRLAIGGENADAISSDLLRSISPQRQADAVRIPILLLHGEDDTVVPARQSRTMNRLLRRADKTVSYHELDGGDHWLLEYETRMDVFQRTERFLSEHLGD